MFSNDVKNRRILGLGGGDEVKGPQGTKGPQGPQLIPSLKPSGFARPSAFSGEKWVKVVDDQNVKTFGTALAEEVGRTLPAQVPQALSTITDFLLQLPFLGELTLKALHVPVVLWKRANDPSQVSVSVDTQSVMLFENFDFLSSDFQIAINDSIDSVDKINTALKKLEEAQGKLVSKGAYTQVVAGLCQEIRRNLSAKRLALRTREQTGSGDLYFKRVTWDSAQSVGPADINTTKNELNIECAIEGDQVTLLTQSADQEKAGFVFDLSNPSGNPQFFLEAKNLFKIFRALAERQGDLGSTSLRAKFEKIQNFLDEPSQKSNEASGEASGVDAKPALETLLKNLKRNFSSSTSHHTTEIGLFRKNDWVFSFQGNVLALHKNGTLESSIDLSDYYQNKARYEGELERWIGVLNAFQAEQKSDDVDYGPLNTALEELKKGLESGITFVYHGIGFKTAPQFSEVLKQKPTSADLVSTKMQQQLEDAASAMKLAAAQNGLAPERLQEMSKPAADFLLFVDKNHNQQIDAEELSADALKALFFLKHNESHSFFEAIPFLNQDAKRIFQFIDRNNDMRKGAEIEYLTRWDELLITRDRHNDSFYLDFDLLNAQVPNFKTIISPFLGADFRALFEKSKVTMPKDVAAVEGHAVPFFISRQGSGPIFVERSMAQAGYLDQMPAPKRETVAGALPHFGYDVANVYGEFTFDSGINTKEDPDSRVHVSLRNGHELRLQGWTNGTLWTLFGDSVEEVVIDLACPFPPSKRDSERAQKALKIFEQFITNLNTRDGQIQPASYSQQAKMLAHIRDGLFHFVNNQPADFENNAAKGQKVVVGKHRTLWLSLDPSGDVQSIRGFSTASRQNHSENINPDFSLMVDSVFLNPTDRNQAFSFVTKMRDEADDDVTCAYLNRVLEKLRAPLFWQESFDVTQQRLVRGRTAHYGNEAVRLEMSQSIENNQVKQYVRIIKWDGRQTVNSDSKIFDFKFDLSQAGLAELDGASPAAIRDLVKQWQQLLQKQNGGKNFYSLDERVASELLATLNKLEKGEPLDVSGVLTNPTKDLSVLDEMAVTCLKSNQVVAAATAWLIGAKTNLEFGDAQQALALCQKAKKEIEPFLANSQDRTQLNKLFDQISACETQSGSSGEAQTKNPLSILLLVNDLNQLGVSINDAERQVLDEIVARSFTACHEIRTNDPESAAAISLLPELTVTRSVKKRSLADEVFDAVKRLNTHPMKNTSAYLEVVNKILNNDYKTNAGSDLTDHLQQELLQAGLSVQEMDKGFEIYIDGQWEHQNPSGRNPSDIISPEEVWNVFASSHNEKVQSILRNYGVESPFTRYDSDLVEEAFALFSGVSGQDDQTKAFNIFQSICGVNPDLRVQFKAFQVLNILNREGKLKVTPQFVLNYAAAKANGDQPKLLLGVYSDQQFWALGKTNTADTIYPLSTREAMAFYFTSLGHEVLSGQNNTQQNIVDPAQFAIKQFHLALQIDARNIEALRGLTKAFIAQGQGGSIKAGIAEMEGLLKRLREPYCMGDAYVESQILVMVALLNIEQGYFAVAKQSLQQALDINPEDVFCKKLIADIDAKQTITAQPQYKLVSGDQAKGITLSEMVNPQQDYTHEQFLALCNKTFLSSFQKQNALAQGRSDYGYADHLWLVTRNHLGSFLKNLRERSVGSQQEAHFAQDFVLNPQTLLGVTSE